MILELPFPPSANKYWRHVGSKVLLSAKARAYRGDVETLVGGPVYWRSGHAPRLRVEIELHPPDAKRRDVDNFAKQLLDALKHAGVYGDDSQIDDLRIVRDSIDRERPRARVKIQEIGP